RIVTEGTNMPVETSRKSGTTKELAMLEEGDRRVEILSSNSNLLIPMNIKAEVVDPIDSRIVFEAAPSEGAPIESWTLLVTDEYGHTQNYGPYTRAKASISGNDILGDNTKGNYKVVMTAKTEDGSTITEESDISLTKTELAKEEALRFSVLFDFDEAQSVNAYETFLRNVVVPLVEDKSTVIIHGHTDTIGEDAYNKTLSEQRAKDTEKILRRLLSNKKNIKYQVFGFGSSQKEAPFDNKFPEERSYNRTVIIDVIPMK
ncbi:MAG: OmpA family protein, partial [Psychroflexus sp.]